MRLLAAEPRSTTWLLFISQCLWNDLADNVFDGVGLTGFKSRANAISLALAVRSFFVFYCFPFLSMNWHCGLWGWGFWTDGV